MVRPKMAGSAENDWFGCGSGSDSEGSESDRKNFGRKWPKFSAENPPKPVSVVHYFCPSSSAEWWGGKRTAIFQSTWWWTILNSFLNKMMRRRCILDERIKPFTQSAINSKWKEWWSRNWNSWMDSTDRSGGIPFEIWCRDNSTQYYRVVRLVR